MSEFLFDLPPGTLIRHRGGRIERVISMQGDFAYCERIKNDGTRDRRFRGWSGSLRADTWSVVSKESVR